MARISLNLGIRSDGSGRAKLLLRRGSDRSWGGGSPYRIGKGWSLHLRYSLFPFSSQSLISPIYDETSVSPDIWRQSSDCRVNVFPRHNQDWRVWFLDRR